MVDGDHDGVRIYTVPARLGRVYAAWVAGRNAMIVAANTPEEQMEAILKLIDRLLEISASKDRAPTRTAE